MPQHIECQLLGTHLGSKRFPDHHEAPTMKPWRCDLTGLSQRYNLYFLACNDTIHIHRPSFPDQRLSDEPALVLHLPTSPEAATGLGIDPEDPHSVTRILIDYLGRDEILLVTCDDGDVIGYRVEEIYRAVEAKDIARAENHGSSGEEDVKFFLHRNVGASAWGLAVHRKARIIAISANTHEVTVIAYALAGLESALFVAEDTGFPDLDASTSPALDLANDFPSPRRKDHVFNLKARTNIPAVSFDNSGDDQAGRWLFSTAIDGKVMIWDLHYLGNLARILQLGWCVSTQQPSKAPEVITGYCACPDRANVAHAAWGAIMLDTRGAHQVSPSEELSWDPQHLPGNFVEYYYCKGSFTLDSNKILDSTLGSGPTFETSVVTVDDEIDTTMWLSSDSDSMTSSSTSESLESNQSWTDHHEHGAHTGRNDSEGDSDEHSEEDGMANVQYASSQDNHGTSIDEDSLFIPDSAAFMPHIPETQPPALLSGGMTLDPNIEGQSQNPPQSPNAPFYQPQAADFNNIAMDTDSDDSDAFGIPAPTTAQAWALLARMPHKRPYCDIQDTGSIGSHTSGISPDETLLRPCLILTKEEMFLVQNPIPSPQSFSFDDPVMTMSRPLHPLPSAPFIGSFDRLCYFTQIPELGAIIVASPVGRVAIFSLYKTDRNGRIPPHYGFKLQYILPFLKGKEHVVTSVTKARLVGVAVAPMQGAYDEVVDPENSDDELRTQPRRWRLLMYHTDHTVLAFELKRRRVRDTPGLDELIV